jgi:hypothetical protein
MQSNIAAYKEHERAMSKLGLPPVPFDQFTKKLAAQATEAGDPQVAKAFADGWARGYSSVFQKYGLGNHLEIFAPQIDATYLVVIKATPGEKVLDEVVISAKNAASILDRLIQKEPSISSAHPPFFMFEGADIWIVEGSGSCAKEQGEACATSVWNSLVALVARKKAQ